MLYTAKTLVDYGSIHTYAVLHYAGTVVTVLHQCCIHSNSSTY